MPEIIFRKSWANIYICGIALFALTVLPTLFVFWDILFWGTNKQLAKYDSWETVIFIEAMFLGFDIILCWIFFTNLSVKFTDEGIWRRGIWGWKFIAWKDVTHIQNVNYGVHIHKAKQKIVVAPVIYSNWNEVARFIRERLSVQTH
jgi:hypothetical protein